MAISINDTENFEFESNRDHVCSDFESELRSGHRPEIEKFLQSTKFSERSTLLSRLIMIEVRYRLLNGEPVELDEYVSRFSKDSDVVKNLSPYLQNLRKEISRSITAKIVPPVTGGMIGRYQLFTIIGSGSFGTVWRAWDETLKRNVAIKFIDPGKIKDQQIDLANHEAQIAAQLNHPHIVRIYDVIPDESGIYLVSEFIDGFDLNTAMKSGRLQLDQVLLVCEKIARALQHAHDKQIIHRDIKPSNIIIDVRGVPMLMDFGIARWLSADQTLTSDRQIAGTAAYMAPEQAQGKLVFPCSDVYSLSAVLYEMLTGVKPFQGTIREILFGHQFRDPKPPRKLNPAISHDVERVCLKGLEKKTRERYATAEEFADDLKRCILGEPVKARRITRIEWSWRWVRRRPLASVSMAIALLACSALAAIPALYSPVPEGYYRVNVNSDPPGADLVFQPIDEQTGYPMEPIPEHHLGSHGPAPIEIDLKPGFYKVIATHEVGIAQAYRTVPANIDSIPPPRYYQRWKKTDARKLQWDPIPCQGKLNKEKLILIPGAENFPIPVGVSADGKPLLYRASILPFLVAPREFSIEDCLAMTGRLPSQTSAVGAKNDHVPCRYDQAMQTAEEAGGRLLSELESDYLMRLVTARNNQELELLQTVADQAKISLDDLLGRLDRLERVLSGPAEWVMGSPNFYRLKTNQPLLSPEQIDKHHILKGGSLNFSAFDPGSDVEVRPEDRFLLRYSISKPGTGFRLAGLVQPAQKKANQSPSHKP